MKKVIVHISISYLLLKPWLKNKQVCIPLEFLPSVLWGGGGGCIHPEWFVHPHGIVGRLTPRRQTDACENITFPQLCLLTVKKLCTPLEICRSTTSSFDARVYLCVVLQPILLCEWWWWITFLSLHVNGVCTCNGHVIRVLCVSSFVFASSGHYNYGCRIIITLGRKVYDPH